jgi:hypothetical protein
MFTCINARDGITKKFATIKEALGMASNCYDGAGIVCTILDADGNQVAYSFTSSRIAYVSR